MRAIADKMILDAEQYRAAIDKPAGRMNCELDKFADANSDDQFFHITCHVDELVKTKIEAGEFIDLEKLLPKDPTRKVVEDNRMELVNRDGSTYFIPASDKESKITNVRKWEQAFRVMPQFTQEPIHIGLQKFGNMCALSIWQPLLLFGRMLPTMITCLDS